MNCSAEILSHYLDGELSSGERKTLEAHLVDCAGCQTALARLRAIGRLLDDIDREPAPADLSHEVLANLVAGNRAVSQPSRIRGYLMWALTWSLGISGLFLALAPLTVYGDLGEDPGLSFPSIDGLLLFLELLVSDPTSALNMLLEPLSNMHGLGLATSGLPVFGLTLVLVAVLLLLIQLAVLSPQAAPSEGRAR